MDIFGYLEGWLDFPPMLPETNLFLGPFYNIALKCGSTCENRPSWRIFSSSFGHQWAAEWQVSEKYLQKCLKVFFMKNTVVFRELFNIWGCQGLCL